MLPLGEETVTALCTFTRHFDERPADLADQILIQSDNKQVRWPAWFALNGLSAPSHGGSDSTGASSRPRGMG